MTFDELIKRCKGPVTLDVNGHRAMYQTKSEYFDGDAGELTKDEYLRIIINVDDDLYSLQFYPSSPVGFIQVWGTSLDEVLRKASEALSDA